MISLLQMLAKKLGCSTSFTDAQKTVIGVGAAVGVGLAAWAVKTVFDWFSAEDDKDKNKKEIHSLTEFTTKTHTQKDFLLSLHRTIYIPCQYFISLKWENIHSVNLHYYTLCAEKYGGNPL